MNVVATTDLISLPKDEWQTAGDKDKIESICFGNASHKQAITYNLKIFCIRLKNQSWELHIAKGRR